MYKNVKYVKMDSIAWVHYTTTVKFGRGSVMVWGCISCDGIGITKVEGRMNGKNLFLILTTSYLGVSMNDCLRDLERN